MATRRIFWGFCRNWFGIGSLHYISSRSFGLRIRGDIRNRVFAEIFVIEKRLPDSPSREVDKNVDKKSTRIKEINGNSTSIPGFFFVKLISQRAGLAALNPENQC
jgi:hypothetical protein